MSYNPNPPAGTALAPPPTLMPAGTDPAAWADYQARWKAYYDEIGRRVDQASADGHTWEVQKLEAQREDARKGLANAMEIARLQADNSRYGVDQQRLTAIDQLQQNQKQFEANHALEIEKLGLSRAQTATEYLATPDRWAQAGNYLNLSSRVLAGQPGAGTYGTAVTPQGNSMSDFAVLASGGNPAGRGDASQAASAGGAGADARVKALKAINNLPLSDGAGHDQNDYAVLRATAAIRGMNLTPEQQSSINSDPEYKAMFGSNLKNLGTTPASWFARQRASLPGQGAANRA